MRSGGHSIGDITLYGADGVTETLERFREQFADRRVVFHDQGAQRLHCITSRLRPRDNISGIVGIARRTVAKSAASLSLEQHAIRPAKADDRRRAKSR